MWWGKYVGIPFAEKGRSMESLDCWGLVQLVYEQECGIQLPSYLECYQKTDDRDALGILIADEKKTVWKPVTARVESFDILIVRMRGVPMHVALVTKPGYMIHCARGVDTVIERYDSPKWRSNVEGVVRYVGESDCLCSPAALQ